MEKKQHVQVPNSLAGKLDPTDVLVYAYLKTYMDKITLEAYPSLETLVKVSDLSINTVRRSIQNLITNKDIAIKYRGRIRLYKFNPNSIHFEMFTYDFLNDTRLNPKQKAYLITVQQFMYKSEKAGTISLNDIELSKLIKLTPRTIRTRNKELEKLNILSITKSNLKEETGLFKEIKQFDLEALGQAVLFLGTKVKEHDDILVHHDMKIKEQQEEIEQLKELINNLKNGN